MNLQKSLSMLLDYVQYDDMIQEIQIPVPSLSTTYVKTENPLGFHALAMPLALMPEQ